LSPILAPSAKFSAGADICAVSSLILLPGANLSPEMDSATSVSYMMQMF